MAIMVYLYAVVIAALLLFTLYKILRIGRRGADLPPGPPTVPLLGNAHMIPTTGLALKFREWAQQYGSIYSLKVLDSTIVVISDPQIVGEMLDKKGAMYSDRPENVVAMHITDGHHFSFEQQGPSWKLKRAITVRHFSPQKLDTHHFRVQEAESVIFMNNLLDEPDRIFDYARLYPVSVACSLLYGHRASSLESFWFKEFYHMMEKWGEVLEPGANPPIEQLSMLWYAPGIWKKRMQETKKLRSDLWNRARQIVDERRALGHKRDSLIDEKLDEMKQNGFPLPDPAFNNLFGELVEAGADTTANQVLTIVMALAKHPEVQKKAQAQIDLVCGPDKPPTFEDFSKLPYINCIIKEGLRWRPTARSALPHRVTKDDYHNGYLIPKGSTIFIAVWSMHQDEKLYPDHMKFNPDRFLNHPKLANEYASSADYDNRDNLHHYGYGAGRRICPGVHLAERNMWRITAKLLWAFNIYEPKDPVTGETIPLDENAYNSSILVSPLPFTVRVVPRSEEVLESVKREKADALDFLSQFD